MNDKKICIVIHLKWRLKFLRDFFLNTSVSLLNHWNDTMIAQLFQVNLPYTAQKIDTRITYHILF